MIIEGGWTSGRGYDRQSKPCGQLCSYKGSHLVVHTIKAHPQLLMELRDLVYLADFMQYLAHEE